MRQVLVVNSPFTREEFGVDADGLDLRFHRGPGDPAGQDYWAYRWARAYVDFAAGEKRSWLHGLGVRWFPLVG